MWSPEEKKLITTWLCAGWLMNIHLVAQMDFASWLRRTPVNHIFPLPNHMVLYTTLAKPKCKKPSLAKAGAKGKGCSGFERLKYRNKQRMLPNIWQRIFMNCFVMNPRKGWHCKEGGEPVVSKFTVSYWWTSTIRKSSSHQFLRDVHAPRQESESPP